MSTTTLASFWDGFVTTTIQTFGGLNNLYIIIFQTALTIVVLTGIFYAMTYIFKKK